MYERTGEKSVNENTAAKDGRMGGLEGVTLDTIIEPGRQSADNGEVIMTIPITSQA